MNARRHIGLLWYVLVLCVFGLLALYSASHQRGTELVLRQVCWIALGCLVCLAVAHSDYHRWLDAAYVLYAVALVLMVGLRFVGRTTMGAARWIDIGGFSLQPSEVAKLATVLILARTLGRGDARRTGLSWPQLAGALALAGLPALMVFKEPDLGSATVIGAIVVGVLWAAGATRRQCLTLAAAVVVAVPLGWHLLHDYQRARLVVFINPNADPLGAGYTIIQSKIAIGSGGWMGKGWLSGTQNQLNFLPERHTDFIFSVIGEEWGFLGSLFVVGLLATLVWQGLAIAAQQQDRVGRLIATGIAVGLGYQAAVNVGMVSGILPVVGVPLPFISYGGSSMITAFLGIGLLESVRRWQ